MSSSWLAATPLGSVRSTYADHLLIRPQLKLIGDAMVTSRPTSLLRILGRKRRSGQSKGKRSGDAKDGVAGHQHLLIREADHLQVPNGVSHSAAEVVRKWPRNGEFGEGCHRRVSDVLDGG
eukprot:scaffold172999_cov39-Tisochrysis_lutea.AAC.1